MRHASARAICFLCFARHQRAGRGGVASERRPELDRIGHIIVVFLENRSFDHLYGLFPGAEGFSIPDSPPSRSVPKAGNLRRCRPSPII